MEQPATIYPLDETQDSEGTLFCTTCGYKNPETAATCLHCAAPFDIACATCGQAVLASNKFCNHCGAQLPESSHPEAVVHRREEVQQQLQALMPSALARKISAASDEIIGEQREVTVLYAGLTETTPVTQPIDDEDSYFLKDEALQILVEVIYKYEGVIDKFTDGGLQALFGAPMAHENDPERAIRAALEMQTALEPWQTHLKQETGLEFQLRLGLNTGQVIAGQVGNDLHMDYTVIGETVNLAALLEASAEPDTILVSAETFKHTRSQFEFKQVPSLTADWLEEPAQPFQVVSLRDKPGWRKLTSDFQAHMIGRAKFLSRLHDALAGVGWQGRSRVALITGEAGLGKSRLVSEFCRVSAQSGAKVYRGGCSNYAQSAPLWVVGSLLRDILGISETSSGQIQRETLRTYLDKIDLAHDEIYPYLLHVLGLDHTDPQVEGLIQLLDATMLQRQTHAALRQLFLTAARPGPTVLVFEDLHRIDPASKDFLDYLLFTTLEEPLMLVLVSRETERETVIRPLVTAVVSEPDRLLDLQLQPLSEAESHSLVDQIISQNSSEAWTLKQHIVSRAVGNPFYVEEISRMLIDQGGLVRREDDSSWQVTPKANELINTVPGTVKGLILARFDRLPENIRQMLQKAAIVGSEFPVSLIEVLHGPGPDVAALHLDELEKRQFLSSKPFRSEAGYMFCHALIQETIYSTLLKSGRRKIHTKIAQAIEVSTLWLPEEQAEVLAYHYTESSNPAKAVPYLITAAENAARRCAYETTIDHYRQAMALQADSSEPADASYFKIRIGLGSALKFIGEFAAAAQILSATLQQVWSWDKAVEPRALASMLVDCLYQLADIRQREGAYDEAQHFLDMGLQTLGADAAELYPKPWRSLLDRMAWIRFRQGQLDEALSLAGQATVDLSPIETDDPCMLASLYNTLGGVSWQQGNLDSAISYVEQSLQLYESIGYMWGVAVAYGNLGILYYSRGSWAKAANYYEQAYAVQQVIGNPEGQAVSFDNLGLLYMGMGEHDSAQKELESGLKIRQRLGDAWGTAQSHVNLAQLYLTRTQFSEAGRHVEAALELADSIGSTEIQIEARWIKALLLAEKGTLAPGLQTADEALEMARTAGHLEKEADVLRALGMLRLQAGQYEAAESALRTSADLSEQHNDPYRQGQTLLEIGRLYHYLADVDPTERDNWHAKAVVVLDQAADRFELLGAAYDLRLTQSLLNQSQL